MGTKTPLRAQEHGDRSETPAGYPVTALLEEQHWEVMHAYRLLLQLCPTFCNPIDCSLPGFSVYGILQARRLEWFAMPYSRGFSWPRDRICVSYNSCIRDILCHWPTSEAPRKPYFGPYHPALLLPKLLTGPRVSSLLKKHPSHRASMRGPGIESFTKWKRTDLLRFLFQWS